MNPLPRNASEQAFLPGALLSLSLTGTDQMMFYYWRCDCQGFIETKSPHREKSMSTTNWFANMAQKAAKVTGSSAAFMAVCALTLVWLASGPIFHWSDTWQLIINTVSNIVAMLMLFLIQNTQNRESAALQLKVDELLRAVRGAQNAFIKLEELTEEDLIGIKERYTRLAQDARTKSDLTASAPEELPE
jgi:low affinity Fe/Cu permease